MTMRFGWLAAAAAMVCSVPASAATLLTQTITFTNEDGRNVVNQLDPRLGPLLEVYGTISNTLYQPFDVPPVPAYSGQPITYYINGSFRIYNVETISHSFSDAISGTYAVNSTITLPLSYGSSFDITDAAGLSQFVGTGSVNPTPSPTIISAVGTLPDGNLLLTPIYSGRGPASTSALTITYVFGLPELSTWAMMIVGVGMIGGLLRRPRNETMWITGTCAE